MIGNDEEAAPLEVPVEALDDLSTSLMRQLEVGVSREDCEEPVLAFLAALRKRGWIIRPQKLARADNAG